MARLTPSPQLSHRVKPWYHHLTLDLVLHVLSRSIFHPAICLIFYLCLASVHRHHTPLAYGTLYYTAVLAGVETIMYLNHRLAYGKPRKLKWKNEVVVITGGGSGLGRILAELLVLSKGARVAVLDIRAPDEVAKEWLLDREGEFWWGVCDIADTASVNGMVEGVKEQLGNPTILINNAATAVVGLPLVPVGTAGTLSPVQASKTFAVNTLSHFNTLSAFLPSLIASPQGGTIVTLSSLLAHLSPSRLADYAASKAALSSLHNSLTHEIAVHPSAHVRQNLKTVLVEPGQLDTQLFADITTVPWYANFFGPILEAKDIAKSIVDMLERGDSGTIRLPFYSKCMPMYGFMPSLFQRGMRTFSGIDEAIIPSKKLINRSNID